MIQVLFFVLLVVILILLPVELHHSPPTPKHHTNTLPAKSVVPPTLEPILPDRIMFVGDIMLARDVDRRTRRANDPHFPFLRINLARQNTYTVGNFEATMPVIYRETPNFTFQFAVPSTSAQALSTAGFTHLSLANNHSLDYGQAGYDETKTFLATSGIEVGGHGLSLSSSSVQYLAMSQGTVALIHVSVVTVMPKMEALEALMVDASLRSDFQIVYIHWGEEYERINNTKQESLASNMIDWGADAIVGHHPHVVQNIAYVKGVPVLYSLGNFVFDQYFSPDVQQGLVASFDFKSWNIRLYPVTSEDAKVQPRYMTATESALFLNELADLSEPRMSSQIQNGVVSLFDKVASSTKDDMIFE